MASGLCQFGAGFAVDRFGARPVLLSGLALLAGGTLLAGTVPDIAWLFPLAALMGIGQWRLSPRRLRRAQRQCQSEALGPRLQLARRRRQPGLCARADRELRTRGYLRLAQRADDPGCARPRCTGPAGDAAQRAAEPRSRLRAAEAHAGRKHRALHAEAHPSLLRLFLRAHDRDHRPADLRRNKPQRRLRHSSRGGDVGDHRLLAGQRDRHSRRRLPGRENKATRSSRRDGSRGRRYADAADRGGAGHRALGDTDVCPHRHRHRIDRPVARHDCSWRDATRRLGARLRLRLFGAGPGIHARPRDHGRAARPRLTAYCVRRDIGVSVPGDPHGDPGAAHGAPRRRGRAPPPTRRCTAARGAAPKVLWCSVGVLARVPHDNTHDASRDQMRPSPLHSQFLAAILWKQQGGHEAFR